MRASRPVQRVVTRFVASAMRESSRRARPARCSRSASAALAMTRTPAAGTAALPWGTSAGKARSVIEPEVWVIERGSVGICVMSSAWNAGSGVGAEAWASFGACAPPGADCAPLLEVGCAPSLEAEAWVGESSPPRAEAFPEAPRPRLFLRACFSPASSRAARTAVRTALFASLARDRCR